MQRCIRKKVCTCTFFIIATFVTSIIKIHSINPFQHTTNLHQKNKNYETLDRLKNYFECSCERKIFSLLTFYPFSAMFSKVVC